MRHACLLFLLVSLTAGCARPGPVTAGGKTVDHWVQAMQSANVKDRQKAVTKLRNLAAADPTALPVALPALTAAVEDKNADVQVAALQALGHIGDSAKAAAPAVRRATQARNPKVRQAALKALEKLPE